MYQLRFNGLVLMTGDLISVTRSRMVSGDLVYRSNDGTLVKSTAWMFPWEKLDPNCHAQKEISK